LNVLSVDGVEPNETSTEDGSYPLARPLFIYSDASIMQAKPQVAAFINFYLSNVDEIITEVGYFPASEIRTQCRKAGLSGCNKIKSIRRLSTQELAFHRG
jgi:hypothetical protein